MKILAVDDNLLTLDLLTTLAGRLGFDDVTTASSGEAAMELVNRDTEPYQCFLMDISMPGMDGIELCGLVRALPAYRKTPIIMLTSMTERDYVDQAFKTGATDYATKPFHITELGARLRMANEINATRVGAPSDALTADSQKEPLSENVQIEGFPGLITYNALGNYLLQLSKAALAGSQVLAVKIDQIERIHMRGSSQEFSYALTEVADAICGAFETKSNMFAYAGNGSFLVVQSKDASVQAIDLELQVQNLLDEKDTEFDNGDPMDLDVSIGNPIAPSINSTLPAWDTFDRAISRAESRMAQKRQHPTCPDVAVQVQSTVQ